MGESGIDQLFLVSIPVEDGHQISNCRQRVCLGEVQERGRQPRSSSPSVPCRNEINEIVCICLFT